MERSLYCPFCGRLFPVSTIHQHIDKDCSVAAEVKQEAIASIMDSFKPSGPIQ